MWAVNAGGSETLRELFGDSAWIIAALYGEMYQVEVLKFSDTPDNKFRIIRIIHNPSVFARDKELVGEFDTADELVAIAKLLLATEQTD